jgi:hypothetical protein
MINNEMLKLKKLYFIAAVFVFTIGYSWAKVSPVCLGEPVELVDLVSEPSKFLGKKIVLEGEFYSFSTLALDYEPAMRSSKDFIGLVLARPDQTEIPLVELKIAASLKSFKEKNINLEHGNKLAIKGKVYAVSLGEPWMDVEEISIID